MILRDQESQLKKRTKVQTKNCGISTKNYVAIESRNQTWLKVKYSLTLYRIQEQTYYYNYILSLLVKKQNLSSLLSLQDITISAGNNKTNDQENSIIFFLERPYVDMSLRDVLQQRYKDELYTLIPQLLSLFLENSLSQCHLSIPANFLVKKGWDSKFTMFINYTSLVAYEFFIQKQDILVSKFQEMACYLHPSIFDYQKQQLNISFQTKIYSLTILILSLILKKQFQMSLQFGRHQIINVNGIRRKWQFIFQNMLKLIGNPIVKGQISQKLKKYKHFSNLKTYFKKINRQLAKLQQPYFQCWKDVFQVLNPSFLDNYMKQQTTRSIEQIKTSLKNLNKETIQLYKKMGIINPNKIVIDDNKDIAIYYMLKIRDFKSLKNIFEPTHLSLSFSAKPHYQFQKYITIQRIAEDNRTQQKLQIQNQQIKIQHNSYFQEIDFNIEKQIQQSIMFNVSGFQLQQNQPDNASMIYAPNQHQKTLDLYGLYLWP